MHLPSLDPYPGYTPFGSDMIVEVAYELLGRDMVCLKRSANILSRIMFSWMNPLMKLGYERALNEKYIWKLDTWEHTNTLINKF